VQLPSSPGQSKESEPPHRHKHRPQTSNDSLDSDLHRLAGIVKRLEDKIQTLETRHDQEIQVLAQEIYMLKCQNRELIKRESSKKFVKIPSRANVGANSIQIDFLSNTECQDRRDSSSNIKFDQSRLSVQTYSLAKGSSTRRQSNPYIMVNPQKVDTLPVKRVQKNPGKENKENELTRSTPSGILATVLSNLRPSTRPLGNIGVNSTVRVSPGGKGIKQSSADGTGTSLQSVNIYTHR